MTGTHPPTILPATNSDLRSFCAEPADKGKRLDVFLAEKHAAVTRSQFARLIEQDRVRVNEKPAKAGHKVRPGDSICVEIPAPVRFALQPEEVSFITLYEDGDILVLSKPPGIVVHPGAGHAGGTLVHGLLHHCANLSGIGGVLRPGIVHRLDKDTSGVMIVAKHDQAHHHLSGQFKAGTVHKKYLALVYGVFEKRRGTVTSPIGRHPAQRQKMSVHARRGREALTVWEVAKVYDDVALLELVLKTGRTHQIRVHLASIGHPVVGDSVYGGKERWRQVGDAQVRWILQGASRQLLHAREIRFVHPRTGHTMEFQSPVPEDMREIIESLDSLGLQE